MIHNAHVIEAYWHMRSEYAHAAARGEVPFTVWQVHNDIIKMKINLENFNYLTSVNTPSNSWGN